MATIRKRGVKWHVQVRRQGYPAVTRSFEQKAEATAWARQKEAGLDRGDIPREAALSTTTFKDLLQRYEAEVLPRKKCRHVEIYYLRAVCRHPLGETRLDKLNTSRVAAYRDQRLGRVSASSVRREFNVLRHCLEIAMCEWGIIIESNPFKSLRMPPEGPSRDRRVTSMELQHLAAGLQKTRNPLVVGIINMAVSTGMRRSEILGVTWGDTDVERRVIRLHDTKNGSPRSVPLSPMALRILQGLPRGLPTDRVFPMSPNALRLSWERLKTRSGIVDLRFHDLRHEAISMFFEAGLSVPEVALISGHKDPRMLFRYTHLRPEAVAARLENLRDDGVTL